MPTPTPHRSTKSTWISSKSQHSLFSLRLQSDHHLELPDYLVAERGSFLDIVPKGETIPIEVTLKIDGREVSNEEFRCSGILEWMANWFGTVRRVKDAFCNSKT
jgi:hypothetical protein